MWFVIALIIGIIPALIAKNKGHSFAMWYVFGVLLFIVALPCSLFLKDISGIQCPNCKEWIKEDASVCKYCYTVIADYYREHSEISSKIDETTKLKTNDEA